MSSLGRRGKVRILSFSLALVIVLGGSALTGWAAADESGRKIEASYRGSLSELAENMSALAVSLKKAGYVTTPPMVAALSADIIMRASAAKGALASLPLLEYNLEGTSRFVSQVPDYMMALSKKSAAGQRLSEEDYASIRALAQAAGAVSDQLQELLFSIDEGSLSVADMIIAADTGGEAGDAAEGISGTFKQMETEFPSYPGLIYDGPFSEHIEKQEPISLKGMAEISPEQAKRKAAEFSDIPEDMLIFSGETGGRLPFYSFSSVYDGGEVTICVTKTGGMALNMISSRAAAAQSLSIENCVKAAEEFLVRKGYPGMQKSYYMMSGGIVTVNFAWKDGGVLYYPDLIKVSVARDNGKVTGFEARGYIMSHRAREAATGIISEEEAKKAVSPALQVVSHELCAVPSAGQKETVCHEFRCKGPDGDIIVYVNAVTGFEERVLILLHSENGVLTQ